MQRCGFQSEMNKTKRKKSIRKIKTTCDNTKKQLTLLLLLCVSMWKKLRSILLFYFHVVDFSEVLLITTEMRMHKMMVTKKKKKNNENNRRNIWLELEKSLCVLCKQYIFLCYASSQCGNTIPNRSTSEEERNKFSSYAYATQNSSRISRWLMKVIRNNNRIIHI